MKNKLLKYFGEINSVDLNSALIIFETYYNSFYKYKNNLKVFLIFLINFNDYFQRFLSFKYV